jgi:branched-chain amino acid aminotransferase
MNSERQEKSYVWFGDKIVETNMALISAFSPSARYGLSVFEGIRGYLSEDKSGINVYRLQDHILRLFRSAERLSLPIPHSPAEVIDAVIETINANQINCDCYVRVDVLSTQNGSWHSLEPGTLTISVSRSIKDEKLESRVQSAAITKWKRIDESQMPPSIKAGANYINSRHGYLDVKSAGYDVPIFLNLEGNVAESSGACIMAVIDGQLITPPISAQILESITRDTLITISRNLEFVAVEKNIHPEELQKASELFLCGTSVEIAPITALDGNPVGNGKPGEITKSMFKSYLNEVRKFPNPISHEHSTQIPIEISPS